MALHDIKNRKITYQNLGNFFLRDCELNGLDGSQSREKPAPAAGYYPLYPFTLISLNS